ncbi:MAG: sugar phosphate nucleotidyltransferase, partial [Oscillospiraceae bacterium]
MSNNYAVILAAGDGKRMKSKQPKVLNNVLFEPMLEWVMSSCSAAGIEKQCVVAGYEHEMVEEYVGDRAEIVLQTERKGTAHAVMQAKGFIEKCAAANGNVLVLCGDAPFMDADTIAAALEAHISKGNDVTVITAILDNPSGYGRIKRTPDGICGIVEQKDASEDELKINEINSGAYWFSAKTLLGLFDKFTCNNAQGEYYLTDAISIILADGGRADAYASVNSDVALGANDKRALYELHKKAANAVISKHFENGVEFLSLDGVIIGRNVKIGLGFHPTNYISTSPYLYRRSFLGMKGFSNKDMFLEEDYRNTVVGNDVWIGDNVLICGGCTINDGVIIGAGSIVTRDLESYGIYAGVPAKLIRKRECSYVNLDSIPSEWW